MDPVFGGTVITFESIPYLNSDNNYCYERLVLSFFVLQLFSVHRKNFLDCFEPKFEGLINLATLLLNLLG